MQVTVIRGDDLLREVWVFVLRVDFGRSELRFDGYAVEERATKRHKWRPTVDYSRWPGRGEFLIRAPLPADVEAEAIEQLVAVVRALRVTR